MNFYVELWDYVADEKISTALVDTLPRKENEIVLSDDDRYWWNVYFVSHVADGRVNDEGGPVLKPRVYLFKKEKPNAK